DFFRNHGVGAWIFLAFSDAVMVFFLIYFSLHLRRRVKQSGFTGVAGLMRERYGTNLAAYIYFAGIFLFLIPYVSIQVRGIAIFLNAAFPTFLPYWGWAIMIVFLMLFYSATGGLRAILYADVVQGTILLIIVWLVAIGCIRYFGGVPEMFATIGETHPKLLSVPGPKGLFSIQFLISSALVIMMLPVTQPQLTTRVVIMKNIKSTHMMAFSVGVFAMLVILPTLALGFYGVSKYGDLSTADFLSNMLLNDQTSFMAAATIIGLIAAALSTSDSQIFAMGNEFRSLAGKDVSFWKVKASIYFFAAAALIFSIFSGDELVLLGRLSFAGTSLLGPMIMTAIFSKGKPGIENAVLALVALVIFLIAQAGLMPNKWFGLQVEMVLLVLLAVVAFVSVRVRRGQYAVD
ncbi:MAG: sodium:solute symporter family protein, partial [Bacteroidota bacterium]